MAKAFSIAILLLLAACAGAPQGQQGVPDACDAGESSHACQAERYKNTP